jgi:hypothetical protein
MQREIGGKTMGSAQTNQISQNIKIQLVRDTNQLSQQLMKDLTQIAGKKKMNWISIKEEFHCEFDRCKFTGVIYTIMGCIEQHLTEVVYCIEHDGTLTRSLERSARKCRCGKPVILAESVRTYLINGKIWETLLRDQQARQVAKLITRQMKLPSPMPAALQPISFPKWTP